MKFVSYSRSFLISVCAAILGTFSCATMHAAPSIDISGDTVVCFAKKQTPLSKFIKPLFEQVAAYYKLHGINFIYRDIDEAPDFYKQKFNLTTMPTIIYFKDGYEIYRHDSKNGTISVDTIKAHVERIYFV